MTDQEAETIKLLLELGHERAKTAVLLCGLLNQSCQTHRFWVTDITGALWMIAVAPRDAQPSSSEGAQP